MPASPSAPLLNPDNMRYILTGNLSVRQNIDSFRTWMQEGWPVLLETDPEAVLTVAGRDPDPEVEALCRGEERIRLVPADDGGGSKRRVMGGLRQGLPVVAHRKAARGYESFVGKGLFLYDDAQTLRRALRAAAVPADRAGMVRAYQSLFSFEAGVKRLSALLDTL